MNKRLKQILMLVFAVALFVPQFGSVPRASADGSSGSAAVPAAEVIYDMQRDNQLIGSGVEGTEALVNSGVKFNVVDNSGAKAIEIFGRTGDYNGVDIKTSLLKAAGGASFDVQVEGRIPSDAVVPAGSQMILGESNGEYSWLDNVAVNAGDSFTLEYTIDSAKVDAYVAAGTNLRVQSNNVSNTFIDKFVVDSIIITRNPIVIYDMQLDSQLVGSGVEGTEALVNSGVKFNVADNSGAKAIEIFGRTADYNGVDIKTSLLKAAVGTSFHVQVEGRIPSDANVPTGSRMILGESNGAYSWLDNTEVNAGDSFTLEYTLSSVTVATYAAAGTNLRVQTNKGASDAVIDKFIVDNILITSDGISTTPTDPPPASDEVVVAYDLQEDAGITDIDDNAGTVYLTRAGGPTLTPISNDDGSVSLGISNRAENWNGIDVKAGAIGLAKDAEYSVELAGHIPDGVTIPSGAKIALGLASDPYTEFKSVDATPDFTLSYEGVWDSGSGLRIQTSGDEVIADFVIDSLIIKVKGGIEMPSKPLPTVPGVHVYTSTRDGWSGANIILGLDKTQWPFSSSAEGDVVAFTPVKDAKYHLTFNATSTGTTGYRVRWITGNENGGYTSADAAVVSDAAHSFAAGTVATTVPGSFTSGVVKDETLDYAVDFTMSGSEVADGLIGNLAIRGMSGSEDFTINSLQITDDDGNVLVQWVSKDDPVVPDNYVWLAPKWNINLPSLKDAYSDYFFIGNILGWGGNASATPWGQENDQADPALKDPSIISQTEAMFKAQYNVVTPENIMKPENISKAANTYDFSVADQLVDWAKANNIAVHGHTLVWHSQSPAWLNKDDAANRASAKANLESYIANVAGHFKGQVISWDVVNEAFSDDTSTFDGSDWTTGLRKDSPWYIAYAEGADESKGESGADYIYDAFVAARLADPDATLYYNDYNETYKYEAIAQMAEDLNAKWATDPRNADKDRKLVEGIGMQSHFWVGQDPDVDATEVETTIQRFIEAGVRISVSELDIPFAKNSNYHLDEAEQAYQAELYGTLFDIYKKYADHIDRVTFWGKADLQSWRGSGMPLLFDNSYRPKAAFWKVMGLEAPSSTISPATVTFYRNSQADARVAVALKDNTLIAIKKGDVELVQGQDYSVPAAASANDTLIVTIKKDYLATLSNNDVLTFVFNAGDTAELKIKVTTKQTNDPSPDPVTPTEPEPGTDSDTPTQTPTPEKPLLDSKLVDAEQVKAAVQQALQANEPINFSDVPATHWAAKAVQLASQIGLIEGKTDGSFHGSDNVTRAEFATMIVRALGLDTTGADGSFSDTAGHSADAYISALHRAGIVNGTGDGSFKPDQEITRAEMAAILARVLNTSAANGTKYSDLDGNWAADYINQLSQAGIVNGVGGDKFAPNATATRDQSVAIIIRMLNIVLDLGLDL
ncbi:endo-1,4-beta-xylanase [Cohnella lubricantis]|uniref:Beta-xylanase n=1 Tax=Cohnella lubricantis TaxID=2163172 RepID=A0A841TBZ4_9BACL|nr:endo-1,4-beta-xylanase [Cohnella lubricantis]MBB6678532.1 endo-1,4-beta-xylanase [Cohnella lubricantis]MBP2119159.1 GH35 family endo-1,4-beta-xylanase/ribosomal protein L14 [Cohnella lubricantis]